MNFHLSVKDPSVFIRKPSAIIPAPFELQCADNGLQVISNTNSLSERSCFCPLLGEADLALADLKEFFQLCNEGCYWCLDFWGGEWEVFGRIYESFGRDVVPFYFLFYGVREPCFKNSVEDCDVPGEEAECIQDSILRPAQSVNIHTPPTTTTEERTL